MKRNYLYGVMASGLVMLSACTNGDDVVINNGELDGAKQEIVLQVKNTGSGLTTRAGRPLLSEQAGQSIQNVAVFIVKNDTVKYSHVITNWDDIKNDSVTSYTNGRQANLVLSADEKLAPGNYKLYAIGYSNGSDYKGLADVKNNLSDAINLELQSGKGEEIFAGDYNFTVTENAGFKATAVLNRQVAGTYGYFDKVPYMEGASKLVLVTKSKLNKTLVLGHFTNEDWNQNGGNVKEPFAVNGTDADNGNILYTIKLSDWFTKIEDADKDGIIDAKNWQQSTKVGGDNYAEGSVFGGTFVIPFEKAEGNTLELQLQKEDGTVLLTWAVKLPAGDAQFKDYTLNYIGAKGWDETTQKDTEYSYNILRNHLYSLGARPYNDPEDPENPDPKDPDDPQDLNNKQILDLRVNSNWEVIHRMEIE